MLEQVLKYKHLPTTICNSPQTKPPKKADLKAPAVSNNKIGIIANEIEPPVGSLSDNGKISIIMAKAARIADSIIACKLVLRMLSPLNPSCTKRIDIIGGYEIRK